MVALAVKIYIIFMMFCLLLVFKKGRTVYVCNDIGAYRYHYKKDCRKLQCHDIKSITEDAAISSYGFIPCTECCGDSAKN